MGHRDGHTGGGRQRLLVPERSEQCDLFRRLGNLVLACAVAIVGTPAAAAKWLLAGSHQFLVHLGDYHSLTPIGATASEVDEMGNSVDGKHSGSPDQGQGR